MNRRVYRNFGTNFPKVTDERAAVLDGGPHMTDLADGQGIPAWSGSAAEQGRPAGRVCLMWRHVVLIAVPDREP
jgi:hypothetical protein